MPGPFSPFSLGEVYQTGEAIKGMRDQSAMAALQQKYLGQRMTQDAAQEQRAVAAEGRAQMQFGQEQQLMNTRLLNMAAAEVSQNPTAAQRWDAVLRAAIPNWEPVQGDPAQIQAAAKQLFESTSSALSAYDARSLGAAAKPSALVEQYQLAKAEGFSGSYLDFVREQSQRQVGAQYGAPVNQPGIGVVQPSRTDPSRNVTLVPESTVVSSDAERARANAAATAAAAATAEQNTERTANQRTLEVWNVAKQGLVKALFGTETGPIAGRLPALTSGQQIAEGAVAAVAPVLKQLFRSAGEGVFTDRDQQLLLEMVPTRSDHPETINAKLQMIDSVIQAKLAASTPGGQSAPPAALEYLKQHPETADAFRQKYGYLP